MNNIDWCNIVKLKDFSYYLNNEELIHLSMSCSKLRSFYSKDIGKCFNFSSFVDSRSYKSIVIAEKYEKFDDLHYHLSNPYIPLTSDLTESKNQFVQDMQVFNKDLKKIIIQNSIDYFYLLYEIPSLFPNITSLVITNSVLTIELLQYLFNNLKNLENLEICENMLIYNMEIDRNHNINDYNINDYTIEWPNYLKSLKLCGNMIINAEDSYSNIIIRQAYYNDYRANDFILPSKLSPNLTTFEYKIPSTYSEDEEDTFQVFDLITQLEILKLSGEVYSYDILNIVKDYKNLTHLEYKCEHSYKDIGEYDNLVLPSIKYLHILADNIECYPLNKMLPNVTDLVIEYDSIIHQHGLENTIENFPNLKRLKFIFSYDTKEDFNFALPRLNYLEKIEINLNYEERRLEGIKLDVGTCDKLKLITFTKNETYSPFENSKHNQELVKDWDYYYFPHKLSYRKNF